MKERSFGNIVITLLFATLHFAVAAVSRMLDYYDDIPLTILTIAMVLVISLRNNTRVELMALLMLVATLLGFLIGTWLWEPMSRIVGNETLAPAISTFLITTILGLSIDAITLRSKRFRTTSYTWHLSTRNILIAAASILVLRMLYVALFRTDIFTEGELLEYIVAILGNTWAILLLLAGNVVLSIHYARVRERVQNGSTPNIWLAAGTLALTLITAITIYFDLPSTRNPYDEPLDLLRILSATLLIDLLIVTICYLTQLSLSSKRELHEERERKHRAEYQYDRLKQQINPHFLFNSLGILDYLVQEQETERASAFIRKLANIYRYMLNNDQKPLIKLSEELDFTNMYIDLLKERFMEGMVIECSIEKPALERMVVPCALQLLVENTTKHNIVAADSPLTISIHSEGDILVVRNNLQPRKHGQPSTHLGLANIRRQYLDITRRDISIEKTDTEFIVKLPIV